MNAICGPSLLPSGRADCLWRQPRQPDVWLANCPSRFPHRLLDLPLLPDLLGRLAAQKKHAEEIALCTCAPSRRFRWPSKRKITPHTIIFAACRSTLSRLPRISVWITPSSMPFAPLHAPRYWEAGRPGKHSLQAGSPYSGEFEKMKIHPIVDRRFWLASVSLPRCSHRALHHENGTARDIPMGSSAKPSHRRKNSFRRRQL